jgi:hypothetical protein
MANFPALKPASRRYSMGQYPVTTETGFGGGNIRFLHGNTSSGHSLMMEFSNLSQAQAKLIRDHYRGQQGGFLPFALSTDAWIGHTSQTDLVPATTLWRYAAPPAEDHNHAGRVGVAVELVAVI